jgi:hypothetical protein
LSYARGLVWKTQIDPYEYSPINFLKGGTMAKKILLLIVGAFLFTIPVVAFGSYSAFQYPHVPVFDNKNTNGVFNVYVEKEGIWQNAGVLSFDRYFRQRTLDITHHMAGRNSIKIKLTKEGGGSAHIDSVLLNSRPPLSASGIGADLKKLMQDDFDVVDASGKGIELEFNGTEGKAILSLSARIEESVITKTPFQYPLENLYKEIGLNSKFYHYRVEKGDKGIEKQIFRAYSLAGSGHPSGYTYGWAHNDGRNLYVKIDFTPDDTMDGDKDYAKVYVKTEEGIKEFKVSVPETRWGNAAFIYTDKVSYQHKVYDFTIPLKEIGITDAGQAEDITLAFAAYGTAAPPPGGAFNPSTNNYLVVYDRSGEVYGQLLDSNGNPVGGEINITNDASAQLHPSVAYNSSTNQYLVVWHDYRNGPNTDIYGQLVNSGGGLSGGNFFISNEGHDQGDPSVAYNSSTNQFLVVWTDYRSGTDWDIYGQLVNANGSLSGSVLPISTAADGQSAPSVAYNSSTNQFLVVWQDHRSGTDNDIYGQLVNSGGGLSGGNFFISNEGHDQYNPSVAYDSTTNQFLVVWQDHRSGATFDIYGQFVDANGTLSGSVLPISTAANNQAFPSIAYNSTTNQFLVVWDDTRNGYFDIYGQYLTSTGALTGGNIFIASNATVPHAVGNTIIGNYLVAYYDGSVARTYDWVIVGQIRQHSIPTMTEWGLIIFTLLAGSGAIYYLRRQRKAER